MSANRKIGLCIGLITAVCGTPAEGQLQPLVDGAIDNAYGDPVAIQNTQTTFGNSNLGQIDAANGSELDEAYGVVDGDYLYIMLTGNLASDNTKLDLFIDSRTGGQNRLLSTNSSYPLVNLARMCDDGSGNGLRFDNGFEADFFIQINCGFNSGPFFIWFDYIELGVARPVYYLGANGAGITSALAGGNSPYLCFGTVNNTNIGGVTAGTGNDSGSGVITGVELAIPLKAIGCPTGPIQICAMINNRLRSLASNQVLKGIGGGGSLGDPRLVNLGDIAGDQYFTVVPQGLTIQDCNQNGLSDVCDILFGNTLDCNQNGIPDDCELSGHDCNGNAFIDECEFPGPPPGASLTCDGIDDFVQVAYSPALNLSAPFTLEAWVKPFSVAGPARILSNRLLSTNANIGYGLGRGNQKLTFTTFGIQDFVTAGDYLSSGTWTHIALVFDSSHDANFYVNGQFQEVVQGASSPTQTPIGLAIGRNPTGTGPDIQSWHGLIDEVRVWNIARTPMQIVENYNARLEGVESGLVGYWRYDEGAGPVANDSASGNNGGLLNGTSWMQVDGDCNANGVPDSCELVGHDCNNNGIPDSCEVASGTSQDCNNNGVPDECDIDSGAVGPETVLLLHADGVGTGFVDSSPYVHSLIANGDAVQSPLAAKFGASGIALDGSGDFLSSPASADWNFGVGDFTIDFWIRPSIVDDRRAIVSDRKANGDHSGEWSIEFYTGPNVLELHNGLTDILSAGAQLPVGTWTHVAVVRAGGIVRIYYDGALQNSAADGTNYGNGSVLRVGRDVHEFSDGIQDFSGFIDELRISKGVARWTAPFTPPGGPYACIGSCSPDCNSNGVPDECELDGNDCDNNSVPDDCELAGQDCNSNTVLDSCDIANGTSFDCNQDQIPDECQPVLDADGDGIQDGCDNCPMVVNTDQANNDLDAFGNACDNCPNTFGLTQADSDGDGLGDLCDNCPGVVNPGQEDCDNDGYGDACGCSAERGDMNGDGLVNGLDTQLFVERLLRP